MNTTPCSFRYYAFMAATFLVVASAYSASIPVTTTADSVDGSLRNAISGAESGDTIVFQIPTTDPGYNPSTGYWVITLTGATAANKTLVIDKDLTIDGGDQKVVVRRANDAPQDFRVFEITNGTVVFSRLWISNGNITDPMHTNFGGGILNSAVLTVRDCQFTGNAVNLGWGGAIANYGTLEARNCTFSGNTAENGGAIANAFNADTAVTTIIGCTFNGNTAEQGGALFIPFDSGSLTLKSSTISGNTSTRENTSGGGGIYTNSDASFVQNTIIAGNTSKFGGVDVQGGVTSGGYNLIGSTAFSSGFNATGDQTNVSAAEVNLGALADYGGRWPTMLPMAGSRAIDRGKRSTEANGDPIPTDQRGLARTVDRGETNAAGSDATDVGAVELGLPQPGPTFTVTTSHYHGNECTADDCTLLEALNLANAISDANTIEFAPGVTGTTEVPNSNGLGIMNPVTIKGPGARAMTVSGVNTGRVFRVLSQNVEISGLTIAQGRVTDDNGAGIHNTGGLTLTDCTIRNSVATGASDGGGIYNPNSASLTLVRCTFYANVAGQFGGGVFNDGTLTATNCTFSSNTALRGGGLMSRLGAVGVSSSTLRNCTITDNLASSTNAGNGDGGGGYFAEGAPAQHHIANTLIAGNFNSINPDVRGNFKSDGHNFIGNVGFASGLSNNVNGDQVGTPGDIKDAQLESLDDNGGPTNTHALLSGSTAIDAGDDTLAPATDQRRFPRVGVSDIGAFEFGSLPTPTPTPTATATPTATPTPAPASLGNISTRLRVETGDNVLIGGFIITGSEPKKLIVRGIGPSLQFNGAPVPGSLENPTLSLYQQGNDVPIETNDNWVDATNKQEIIDSTVAPKEDLESAILTSLSPGSYTAILRGVDDSTGVASVELYDLDAAANAKLAQISTRGFVQTGDNVMIGGLYVVGNGSQRVIVRAIGPSLPVPGKLADPTLELFDGNGTSLASNDNWRTGGQEQDIIDTTVPPTDDAESAIVRTLTPGPYTAIVRGVNEGTGVALVEVYGLGN